MTSLKVTFLGVFTVLLVLGVFGYSTFYSKPEVVKQIYFEFKAEAIKRDVRIPKNKRLWSFEFESLQGLKAGKCSPDIFWNKYRLTPKNGID